MILVPKLSSIEAIVFDGENVAAVGKFIDDPERWFHRAQAGDICIQTPRGQVTAKPGDTIARLGPGKFWIIPPHAIAEAFE